MKEHQEKNSKKYIEGVGRRKTATARVRIYEGKGDYLVNEKPLKDYFKVERFIKTALAPFELLKIKDMYFTVKVKGGGIMAQSEAVRHGLSRALVKFNESFKKLLREAGFLTRDPRMVERKKYGLKKARRAPQWQKR
jgi:small subunit ribosomal protein S9